MLVRGIARRAVDHHPGQITIVRPDHPRYPPALTMYRGVDPPPVFTAWGNLQLLEGNLIGLVCSARCPGPIMLEMYDLATSIPGNRCVVVGGFHSPMERECLEIWLARHVPVVFCAARPMGGMRIPVSWRLPLTEDRLLIVSPYLKGSRRATKATASHRNRFVAAISTMMLIPYAEPGGIAARIGRIAAGWGKDVITVRMEDQPLMRELGARPIAELGDVERRRERTREGETLVLTPG